MRIRIIIMVLLLFGIAGPGCKKDEAIETSPTPSAINYLLTGKNWKMTSWISNPVYGFNGPPTTDIFSQLPNCLKDDLSFYNTDGTVTYNGGDSLCDPGEPQIHRGTWSFNGQDIIIQDGHTLVIDFLDANIFRYKRAYNSNGVNYIWTITSAKQ
jgi:hypothetical protein